jgi:5-methylcytosine-specific restriction protein A
VQASLPLTPEPIDDEVRNDPARLKGDTYDVDANSQSDVIGNLDDLLSSSDDIGIPDRALKTRSEFQRDAALRRAILKSANGRCEHCGRQGFLLQNGLRYLEVHHIIALANDGQDTQANLIALCPEHHREAHFGADAEELEKRFLERVKRRARTHASATT